MWANAVEVSEATKSTYITASAGTEILMSDIEQMFVWIPRYSYDPASIVQASEAIDVTFVSQTVPAHPAFTFGTDELEGLWVGKFEMGFKTGEDETTSNVSYVIKPNLNSVHNTNVSTMYDKINDITITNGDIHMMKNTEWGLVAYLSQSKYGVCNNDGTCTSKVANNAYSVIGNDISTGCGPIIENNAVSDLKMSTVCPDTSKWNTTIGQEASTTNNIYGIYDMAGGRGEYMMSGIYDQNGNFNVGSSGFVTMPEVKYYDSYIYDTSGNNYNKSLIGDAIKELNPNIVSNKISNWNEDYGLYFGNVFMHRGGAAYSEASAGIFYFSSSSGESSSNYSSRASLAIETP